MQRPRQYVRIRTERRLAELAAITAITVMSRSRFQGNRGYHSNRSVPFQAVTRHHGDYSVMGTLFNPAVREATDSLNQLHSAKAFPPITELVGRGSQLIDGDKPMSAYTSGIQNCISGK